MFGRGKLLVAALAAAMAAGIAALLAIGPLGLGVSRDAPRPLAPVPDAGPEPDRAAVEAALLAAGLNPRPVLGDTGVSGHLARLDRGEASARGLMDYAAALEILSERSAARGARIPPPFWDVDTPAMARDGWTAHAVATHLAAPRGARYLDLLSDAWARFHAFRAGGEGTALGAAFDLFDLAAAHVAATPEPARLQHAEALRDPEAAALMAWQTLVAGTTRRVPGLGRPAFDHGYVGRFNVATIWQYETGEPMSVGRVWGVSGFAPRFVGPASNDNQIEHMTISALLQGVLGTPLAALDALELEKAATGRAPLAEARADMALNGAVHAALIAPGEDLTSGMDALREALMGTAPSR